MIRRRDHEWLPFWRYLDYTYRDGRPIVNDLGWVVSVAYTGADGRRRIGVTVPSRWRLVALWRGLRGNVR